MPVDHTPAEILAARDRIDALLSELSVLVTASADPDDEVADASKTLVLTGWVLAVEWTALGSDSGDDIWTAALGSPRAGRAKKVGLAKIIEHSFL